MINRIKNQRWVHMWVLLPARGPVLGGAVEDSDFGFCSAGVEVLGDGQCCLHSLSGRSRPHGSGDHGLSTPRDTRRRHAGRGGGRGGDEWGSPNKGKHLREAQELPECLP